MDKSILLGVSVTNDTKEDILQYILTSLEKKTDPYYITTPNPEILVYASKHPEFKTILNNARLGLPDGIGVTMAGKFLGKPFKQRVTGVDFMEYLCREISEKPITVGFLGGWGGVAEKAAECLKGRYPGLKVAFVGQEWGEGGFIRGDNSKFKIQNSKIQVKSQKLENEELYARRYTLDASIDILFVAFGFPKQEEFMARNVERSEIPVKVMIGVGGAFDYISGAVPRAPLLIRSIGFEWFFRLFVQPWRIKRQLSLLKFMYLVLKEKLRNNRINGSS